MQLSNQDFLSGCRSSTVDDFFLDFLMKTLKPLLPEIITIKNKAIPFNHSILKGELRVILAEITDVREFENKNDVTTVKLNREDFQLYLGLKYKELTVSVDFEVDLEITGIVELKEKGHIEISLGEFEIDAMVDFAFKPMPLSIKIQASDLKLKYPHIEIVFTKVRDECLDKFLGWQATDVVNGLIEKESAAITEFLNTKFFEFLRDVVNPMLPPKEDEEISFKSLKDKTSLRNALISYGSKLVSKVEEVYGITTI